MEELTLSKALVELKLLNKRIDKRTEQLNPVAVKQSGKILSSKLTQPEFESEAKACWQSIRDLLARRRKIKRALVVANASTKVKVCGKEYTLAEAIEEKQMMEVKRDIIERTREKLAFTKGEIEGIEFANKEKLMQLLNSMYGSGGKEHSLSSADHDAVAIPFKKANEPVLVDPLNCEKMLVKLEDDMENFLAEVDVCLSVANATTIIQL